MLTVFNHNVSGHKSDPFTHERAHIYIGTTPCLKHVFLKYFSIKAELLAADITADSGSKFCIGNI